MNKTFFIVILFFVVAHSFHNMVIMAMIIFITTTQDVPIMKRVIGTLTLVLMMGPVSTIFMGVPVPTLVIITLQLL